MNWIIEEKISEGSFSNVYRVRNARDNRIAALKIIHQALHNQDQRRRFKRSFIAAKKLNNPHLVKMIEWIEQEDKVGFVMEYVDGDSLRAYIQKIHNYDLNLDQVISIICQVCEGLNELHGNQIVHRDLKPENILIDKSDQVKITDFDLMKLNDDLQLTMEGLFLGSIHYSSPEQCVNASKIDHRSDLYSLGIILFEMLTGKPPFTGNSFAEIAMAHINQDIKDLSKPQSELPDPAKKIICKLLHKKPYKRYESCQELSYQLVRLLSSTSTVCPLLVDTKIMFGTMFLGRKTELKELKKGFERANNKQGSGVYIYGEGGIGKSRLWEEFKLNLDLEQIPAITVNLKEHGYLHQPFKILINSLINSCQLISELKRVKLLGNLASDLMNIDPDLKNYEFSELLERIPVLSGEEAEMKFFQVITKFLINFSETAFKNPSKFSSPCVVLIFDDLQLSDAPFIRWLKFSERDLKKSRIFIIALSRKDMFSQGLVESKLEKDTNTFWTEIHLSKIDPEEISHLFNNYFGESLNKREIKDLVNYTQGLPLFIKELIDILYKNKIHQKIKNLSTITEAFNLAETDFYSNLIEKKLTNLSVEQKSLAELNSIAGEYIDVDMSMKLLKWNETKTLEVLDQLAEESILIFSENQYCFNHSRIREVILNNLNKDYFRKMSLAIAEYYESELMQKVDGLNLEDILKYQQEDSVNRLSEFYWNSGVSTKTVKYALIAGDIARLKFDNEKALKIYQKVEAEAQNLLDLKTKVILHRNIGEILEKVQKFKHAEKYLIQACKDSEQCDDNQLKASVNRSLGNLYTHLSDFDKAEQSLLIALRYQKNINDLVLQGKILSELGYIYSHNQKYDKAENCYQQQLDIGQQLKDMSLVANSYSNFGNLCNLRGKFDQALKYFKKSADINRTLANQDNLGKNYKDIGNIYIYKKAGDKSEDYFNKFIDICDNTDNKYAKIIGLIEFADSFSNRGETSKALHYYEQSLEISSEVGSIENIINLNNKIGDIYLLRKEFLKAKKKYLSVLNYQYYHSLENQKVRMMLYKAAVCSYFLGNYQVTENLIYKLQNSFNLKYEDNLKFKIILLLIGTYIACNKYDQAIEELNDCCKECFKKEELKQMLKTKKGQQDLIIANLLNKVLDNSKKIEEKAEIYYQLWNLKYKSDDQNLIRQADIDARNACKLYKRVIEHSTNPVYKLKYMELEEYLDSTKKLKDEMKLIQRLVKLLKPETAYREFLNYLQNTINADSAILIVRDDLSPEMIISKFVGSSNASNKLVDINNFEIRSVSTKMENEEIDLSKGILSEAVITNQPVLIPDAIKNEKLKNNPSIIEKSFLSVIAVPLILSKDEIFGALYLDRRNIEHGFFTDQDVEIVLETAEILTPILVEHEKIKYNKHLSEIKNLGLFIGNSPSMKELYRQIENCSKMDMIVYITGETGSGKELVARALHKLSNRRDKPLVAINCSAVPESLAETELFGHEKGAFSGAVSAKKGKFELAQGGTLLLDEIADIPIELQTKLLRVLQNNEIWRVGGQSPIKVDVRVLVSTHRDLYKEVENGNFREDLYHRLDVLKIRVPPLRERLEDITSLAYHILEKYNNLASKNISGFNQPAIDKLTHHHWPGNIRELENVIAKVVVNHHGDNPIDENEIMVSDKKIKIKSINDFDKYKGKPLSEIIEDVEVNFVEKALSRKDWNISKTAKELNIGRAKLYRIIDKNNLKKSN
ncbi:MAG: hypothetical protein APR63_14220 [Desulfuromonas sp. SDB]|nr:MAG: hypothetical protein APR63_14220 [Desulfuromonas sp. SDB]